MTFEPGRKLGPYEILTRLGSGGMGEVFRARDSRLGRDVAIKALPPGLKHDPEALARFEREAKAVAAISHPNIVVLFDLRIDADDCFAVLELLEGETLRERIRRGALPWDRATGIAAAVAEGLSAAHGKGIIHRDLKPDNIFLTADERVKILDFGLARTGPFPWTGDGTAPWVPGLTGVGTVLGTLGYMSPEQVRGEPVDARGDLFALGCVLFEMLTGRAAFVAATPAETLAAVLKDDPPEWAAAAPDVPPDLRHIVARCLEKRRGARFQSAGELTLALKSVLQKRDSGSNLAAAGRAGARICLAVLPLQNLSPAKHEDEYLADGMTEALIADLAKIRALRVVSRTSVMQYKETRKPLREIAAELGAAVVVEGSVLHVGSQVRITAQLIDAETDEHLWAESYQGPISEVLVLQSQVARAIAREIDVVLTPDEATHLESARPVKAAAYNAFIIARHLWNRGTGEDLKKSVEYLKEAVEADSGEALRYVGVDPSEQWYRSPIWKGKPSG